MGDQRAHFTSILMLMALCFGVPCVAQDQAALSIEVWVSAPDHFANELRSCVNKEVRNLGDTLIVDDKGRFTLQVVAMDPHIAGRAAGYVASTVVVDHTDAQKLAANRKQTTTTARELIDQLKAGTFVLGLEELGVVKAHNVNSDADLPRLCRSIVATLDSEVLEVVRRAPASVPAN